MALKARIGAVTIAAALFYGLLCGPSARAQAGELTATGKAISPTAATGSVFEDITVEAGGQAIYLNHAVSIERSPDGRTLAILTTGNNLYYGKFGEPIPSFSKEYVVLYDITGAHPRRIQFLALPSSYFGLIWSPNSRTIFASNGEDDSITQFDREGGEFVQSRVIRLRHKTASFSVYLNPMAGALAINPAGTRLLVANLQNDSVSLINLERGLAISEADLRPGKRDPTKRGVPGGTYPSSVVWTSNSRAYVASGRDREIITLSMSSAQINVGSRLPVHGQPVALTSNAAGTRVYAALDNSDYVAVIDTKTNRVVEEFSVLAPESVYLNRDELGGANSNGLALTPGGDFLLVTNGGQNALAVVRLGEKAKGPGRDRREDVHQVRSREEDEAEHRPTMESEVVGLVPTGWYPTGVTTAKDGTAWYVINAKSDPGANADWCRQPRPDTGLCDSHAVGEMTFAPNGQGFLRPLGKTLIQQQKAGLLSLPAPPQAELERLTRQVARNNQFDRPDKSTADKQLFDFLRSHIKHVIYVIKENRSYDQVLGDLPVGNGDPRLAVFGARITPNQHAIASQFVTLDNFLVSGEGSWTGWQWSVAGRTSDFAERNDVLGLGRHDHSFVIAYAGIERKINTAYATSAERRRYDPSSPKDPDVLPGSRDVAELDGPHGAVGKGYIWDSALRAGLGVRNYGFFVTLPANAPVEREPFVKGLAQAIPSNASLIPYTDRYFRPWDFLVPDYWRLKEWKREFDGFVAAGRAPELMQIWLGSNHIGNFDKEIDRVNTPETQVADNDYAFGQLVEAVARSPFADDTLIVSIEDDSWDGTDHVNAFRSPIFIAGPYVRRGQVVSTRYTTVNVVKTIEEILGIAPVSLNDAVAAPMSDVFDADAGIAWSFRAQVPNVLRTTGLPLPPPDGTGQACIDSPRHSSAYWSKALSFMNYSEIDRGAFGAGNLELWRGLKGAEAYPGSRSGEDLSQNRAALLQRYASHEPAPCLSRMPGASSPD